MIGILALFSKEVGGVYQYTQALVESLVSFTDYEYVIIKEKNFVVPELSTKNFSLVKIEKSPINLAMKFKRGIYTAVPQIRKNLDVSYNFNLLKKYKFDLLINPGTDLNTLYINKIYIVTIHDLQHKYYTHFFSLGERLLRDYYYKRAANNAAMVVCKSNHVKNDIMKFFGIPEEKIRIIDSPPPKNRLIDKFEPEKMQSIRLRYQLPEKFLFYPAQFWYHKNHIKLMYAIQYIKQTFNETIPVILVGAKKENFDPTMAIIRKLNLTQQVKWLGYVPDDDFPYIFKLATALVLPTLFESISIPIWEAFYLGCPVISSNICALPVQVRKAGLLFNPTDIKDMAEKILAVWRDEGLRRVLTQSGYKKVNKITFKDYAEQWQQIIEKIITI